MMLQKSHFAAQKDRASDKNYLPLCFFELHSQAAQPIFSNQALVCSISWLVNLTFVYMQVKYESQNCCL